MPRVDVGDCVCVHDEHKGVPSVVPQQRNVDVVIGDGVVRIGIPSDRSRSVPLDDMPKLSNARRVLRLAMVLDEVRSICKLFVHNTTDDVRLRISAEEFRELGGSAVQGKEYSLYRQLVYAKRDAKALSQRMSFPKSLEVQKAHHVYKFYPSDSEDVDELDAKGPMKRQDASRIFRIALVLKRFRIFLKKHGAALASDAARNDFHAIHLTKREFVLCGGFGTVSSKTNYSFYRQIVYAKRDIELILRRGHFGKGRLDFRFGLLWRECKHEPASKSDCLQNDSLLAALTKQRAITPRECMFTLAEWHSFNQPRLSIKNYVKVEDDAFYFPVVGDNMSSEEEEDSDDSVCLRALDVLHADGEQSLLETTLDDGLDDGLGDDEEGDENELSGADALDVNDDDDACVD